MAWMTILGLDWKGGRFEHPFDIVDVPQKSGVFKLHARQANGEWDVFFVGQAPNLYATLLAYMGTISDADAAAAGISACAKEQIATSEVAYSFALVPDEADRKGCLRSLFDYFQPACNNADQVPDITNIGCNPF
ncbi:MAG: hypothetical protein K0R39_4146 [Symbiobacteriaceae bacterium]|jgi:hypothetical protein|nr:hypothetical protein [Symbiobacteriaceae bacterium]